MKRFIQIHMLTAYPPANLNRDDQGSPKTAKMGGYDRLRVSSQCLKRTWRTSEIFEHALAGHLGKRTKEMGLEIYNRLTELGVSHKKALEWTKSIAGVYGKLKTHSKKDRDAVAELDEDKRLKKVLVEVEIEQLAFFDTLEQESIFSLINTIAERGEGPTKDELNLLRKPVSSADIALFGRMLADSPNYNIEAAYQVAHSISVHPIAIEDDYFTAVDDLNTMKEDMGAAHIGETRFSAGLFYSYICINLELLIENLNGHVDLAIKTVRALVEAAVKVAPEGKQNSFGSRAYASYVLAEKGDQQPRTLSAAFLKPINHRDNDDFLRDSIKALLTQQKSFDAVYGACADGRYTLNILSKEGVLTELLDFVGK